MDPVTPLTVAGALLSSRQRCVLDASELQQLAGRFPSTAHLSAVPWNATAVTEEASACWAGICDAVDPVFCEVAEEDFGPSLPDSMQALSTLRFLLSLWRPGVVRPSTGSFDLLSAFLCHWDASHRAVFLQWATTGRAGPTGPSERHRLDRERSAVARTSVSDAVLQTP